MLIPLLLIHGFNGSPENWRTSGFLDRLIARGAEPSLIRLFDYGQDESGRYNNQADIRRIAARLSRADSDDPATLDSQIMRLSEASVARGGPSGVTIIAHSMGGLIARYYLSRQAADEFGTRYDGEVARLITIGTPHQGMALTRVVSLVPPDSLIARLLGALERLGVVRGSPRQELAALDAQGRALQYREQEENVPIATEGYLDSPAVRQMIPGSPFLQELNAPGAWPQGVEGALIWGDVQIGAAVRWGRLTLWQRIVTLGDLLVEAASASQVPNAHPQRYPMRWERHARVQIGDPQVVPADLNRYLPPVSHSNLLANEQVQGTVVRLVGLAG